MRKRRHTEVVHETKSPTLTGLHNSGEGRQANKRSGETELRLVLKRETARPGMEWAGVGRVASKASSPRKPSVLGKPGGKITLKVSRMAPVRRQDWAGPERDGGGRQKESRGWEGFEGKGPA